MTGVKNIFDNVLHLFYPHNCNGCGSDLLDKSELLCVTCLADLPHTRFEMFENNFIERIFTGRLPFRSAYSQFYFSKGQLVQQLIHRLKYSGDKAIGEYLGAIMGNTMLRSERFSNIDYLVPLPLYPDKQFKRGYNQAEIICNGIGEAMQIPVMINNVIRRRATETQTKKHRAERWQNVDGSFAVSQPEKLTGKHVLLVDDVITTGASLEACASAILKVAGIQISFASLAHATK